VRNESRTDADRSAEPAASSADGETLDVLLAPDYTSSNPYQANLAEGLANGGATVSLGSGRGYLLPLSRLAADEGLPDVLHLHFFTPFMIVGDERLERFGLGALVTLVLGLSLLVDLALLRLRGVVTVWTVHDLVNHERRYLRIERAVKHVAARFLFDRIVVHCATAGEEFRRAFSLPASTSEKTVVIPHGHFLDDYPNEVDRETARDHLDLPSESTVFLFFGWIRPYKNVPRLVEQFKRLDSDRARLLVVGSARSAALERTIREASADDDRIETVLEFVPDDEVQYYMNAADAVVLPFRTEERSLLTSGSVLLAMGFGNAVVAPAIGCIGTLLDDEGGVCYDRGATDQPLSGMRALLDADTDAMSEHNRRTVESLDWDTIGERTHRTYQRAVAER